MKTLTMSYLWRKDLKNSQILGFVSPYEVPIVCLSEAISTSKSLPNTTQNPQSHAMQRAHLHYQHGADNNDDLNTMAVSVFLSGAPALTTIGRDCLTVKS